jgi:hypothetical protein
MKQADGRPSKRRYLPEDKTTYPSRLVTPALPGVTTHVLGPPTDPAMRKHKKVPSSWALGPEASGNAGEDGSPFPAEWQVDDTRLPGRRPFTESTLQSIRLFNEDLAHAAKALEGFLNGESLVLLLEFGKARLLLTGDAEVGAWTTILNDPEALALAASATLVKIGHHGSHNATPISFVREHVAEKTPALISTQAGPEKFRNGIPFKDLTDILATRKMPFSRSDRAAPGVKGLFTVDPQKRWVDCAIPC